MSLFFCCGFWHSHRRHFAPRHNIFFVPFHFAALRLSSCTSGTWQSILTRLHRKFREFYKGLAFFNLKAIVTSEIIPFAKQWGVKVYLKVMTALVMGQPITKDFDWSKVTSDTSEMQVDSHRSDRGTWIFNEMVFYFIGRYCSSLLYLNC